MGWTVHTGARAEPVVSRLVERGLRACHRPLLRTVGLPAPPLPSGPGDVILVTSRAAVTHGLETLKALEPGREVWAVGPGSAAALERAGIAVRQIAGGTGAALLDLLGSRTAIFVGALRPAGAMAAALQRRPGLVHCPVYDRRAVQASIDWLASGPLVSVATFTSPAGVECWADATPLRPPAVAIGPTTAGALRGAGFPTVEVAATPTPGALVEAVSAARCG